MFESRDTVLKAMRRSIMARAAALGAASGGWASETAFIRATLKRTFYLKALKVTRAGSAACGATRNGGSFAWGARRLRRGHNPRGHPRQSTRCVPCTAEFESAHRESSVADVRRQPRSPG